MAWERAAAEDKRAKRAHAETMASAGKLRRFANLGCKVYPGGAMEGTEGCDMALGCEAVVAVDADECVDTPPGSCALTE